MAKQVTTKKKSVMAWIGGGLAIVFALLFIIQMTNEKSANTSGLPEGKPAPQFTLQSTQGEISLANYKGKNVVLYFYEGSS